MSDPRDDEATDFMRHQTRQRIMLLVGMVVALGLAAGFLWWSQPRACDQFAKEMCKGAGMGGSCRQLGDAITQHGIPQSRCAETLEGLQGALESSPRDMHDMIRIQSFAMLIEGYVDLDEVMAAGRAAQGEGEAGEP